MTDALTLAAKNIRKELKAAFPQATFSVKSSRFAGGNAIRIAYEGIADQGNVRHIVSKYEAGSFDGMTDSYTYERTEFHNVNGSAKYITISRV